MVQLLPRSLNNILSSTTSKVSGLWTTFFENASKTGDHMHKTAMGLSRQMQRRIDESRG
ncbi:hypothetical protein M408DRAFT_331601 [Serendipita vermifera MAFF 305830]|uniref:Uncharacterized protein n=1 Tax=Serendipita vermifera MAFF 305830 TaxID=933852 RepID=A0A0C2X657_SERVB|nr:hypothetical protein M408DRAFT_331601 [Serendipita vermifera MAFF 305830]